MSKSRRIAIISLVAVVFVAALTLKESRRGSSEKISTLSAEGLVRTPRLVDLGANKCIPCKMMAPILAELKKEYRGRLEVDVIDVSEDRAAGGHYGIRVIPTQIFYDDSGRERFRHEGFMSKEAILDKWRELGVDLKAKGQAAERE